MGLLTTSYKCVFVRLCTILLILAGNSDSALMVGFEQPSYNVSEEDGMVTLSFNIEGATMENSIELNLTISDPSDSGRLINEFNFSNPITVGIVPMGGMSPMQTADVSIPIDFADDTVENTETFVVMLSSSDSDVTVNSSANTTVNIEDNDILIVEFVMTEFNVSESDGTVEIVLEANGTSQFDYFISLSIGNISTGGLAVNITMDVNINNGTAISPADYDASLMYVTLLATTNSMTTAELRITIQDEDILERDEDFTIMLNTMETRVNIANSTSVVIMNDDVLTVEFQNGELNVSEAMGTVEVTVMANGTSEFDYTVNLTTSDIATDSNDHNLTEYIQLEIPAGSTTASVLIAIDDDVYENIESFKVAITSTSDEDVLIGMKNEITVNIEDDEMITVFFQEDPFSFSESDGEAVVTVYADLPTGGLAVNITLDVNINNGTAISPDDYDASLMYVTLLAITNSMTTAELRITIQDEIILEGDEDFTIMLNTMETRVNIVNSTSVVILNDDVLTVGFQFSEFNVSEAMGTVEVTVIANGTSEFDYAVNLTTSDITTDSSDHNLTEYIQLEFPAGSTSASAVIAIDDDVYENTESFQVAIPSTSDDDVLIGMINEITANIEDDEMITVFFQEDSYSFSESVGEAVVTVYVDLPSGGLAVNITLGVNITNGNATSPGDYDASLVSVTLYKTTNSMTMVELRIIIVDEDILENDEDFNIMLSISQTRLAISNSTSVIILNDDPCPCQNGGTCVFDNKNINCTCAENFIGQFCQTAVVQPFGDIAVTIGVSVAVGVTGIGLVGIGIGILVAILACPK